MSAPVRRCGSPSSDSDISEILETNIHRDAGANDTQANETSPSFGIDRDGCPTAAGEASEQSLTEATVNISGSGNGDRNLAVVQSSPIGGANDVIAASLDTSTERPRLCTAGRNVVMSLQDQLRKQATNSRRPGCSPITRERRHTLPAHFSDQQRSDALPLSSALNEMNLTSEEVQSWRSQADRVSRNMPDANMRPAANANETGPLETNRHGEYRSTALRVSQHSMSAADDFETDPTCAGVSAYHRSGWSTVELADCKEKFSSSAGVIADIPANLLPYQRSLHSASVLNGVMYVFGGYDGQARVNDFHAYSFVELRWYLVLPSVLSSPPPSPRDRHISVAHGSTVYVFGGFDGRSRVSDFHGFNVNTQTWNEVQHIAGDPPSPRHSHAAVVYNDSMFVFGGYDGSYRSDLHEYNFRTSSWRKVQTSGRPPRARYRTTCVVHSHTMVVFGGHDGTRHLADAHVFDFETLLWSSLPTEGTPPLPRDSHVSVVHDNSMYVFGGSTGSAMNDLHKLMFNAQFSAEWIPVVTSGMEVPRHRFCHIAVVFRDSLFVFGGYDGSHRLDDFLRFDFGMSDTTCEVQPSTLIADLKSFVNNNKLSDVTFVVEGQEVYAHKFMLIRSSYFRAMFFGEMREATQSKIVLEHIRHAVFISLLEYIYTDEVQISLELAIEIFTAADEFCVPRLKSECEKQILSSISVENAASIFLAADRHSAESLKHKTLSFILSRFEQVSKTSTFEEMARTNVELVFEILRNR